MPSYQYKDLILKIRQSHDHLIFISFCELYKEKWLQYMENTLYYFLTSITWTSVD